jgi:hypothetical protein
MHAPQEVSNVQKAISIVVAAFRLGAAIMVATPGTISSSVDTLVQAISQADTKTPEATSST